MKRNEISNDKACCRLDKLNNDRVNTTRARVAHAIRLISMPLQCLVEKHGNTKTLLESCAHANTLLEAAHEEMQFACEYWEWNDDVCYQIEDAIGYLGAGIAFLEVLNDSEVDIDTENNDDAIDVQINVKRAFNILGMVVATLTRWFDDSQDVSEI